MWSGMFLFFLSPQVHIKGPLFLLYLYTFKHLNASASVVYCIADEFQGDARFCISLLNIDDPEIKPSKRIVFPKASLCPERFHVDLR